jgi:phosphatidylglycerol---prolipoprotein diacylglyceryl transferase
MLTYPNINPVFLKIGALELRWYGLMYILGIVLGFLFLRKKLQKNLALTQDQILNLLIYIISGIILGGRLGYVLIYNLSFYLQQPKEILAIWHGGMSFHGAGLGCILALFIFALNNKSNFYLLLDFLALGAPIGLMLGRVANFINGELYGRVTTLPWGMVFPAGGALPRHPSQLYEAFFEGALLFLIMFLFFKKANLKTGQLFACFLMFYGFFRFGIEFFRAPDAQIGLFFNFFSMGQILSLIMLTAGLVCFFIFKKKQEF